MDFDQNILTSAANMDINWVDAWLKTVTMKVIRLNELYSEELDNFKLKDGGCFRIKPSHKLRLYSKYILHYERIQYLLESYLENAKK